MKTEQHPYSTVIHYATGGVVDHEKNTSDFSTMCGRHFRQGHSAIMDSGYSGVQRVTCKVCKTKLKEYCLASVPHRKAGNGNDSTSYLKSLSALTG